MLMGSIATGELVRVTAGKKSLQTPERFLPVVLASRSSLDNPGQITSLHPVTLAHEGRLTVILASWNSLYKLS